MPLSHIYLAIFVMALVGPAGVFVFESLKAQQNRCWDFAYLSAFNQVLAMATLAFAITILNVMTA